MHIHTLLTMIREHAAHTTPVTDTDDTSDDESVGGFGLYSHSHYCHTHQHWVDQVISAGGFNVHCTQASEASHKINMHMAARRVRHYEPNKTQDWMLQYLCNLTTFGELKHLLKVDKQTVVRKVNAGVRQPLTCTDLKDSIGDTFLHREVRLAEFEVANLICQVLDLPVDDVRTHDSLKVLSIRFWQKLLRQDGRTFWATPDRHDVFRIKNVHTDCLCGEAVCFLSIDNLKTLLPDHEKDSMTLCLIRYLQHHPSSWERDLLKRPVCPGPLHVNNCLWEYARTTSPRKSLIGRTVRQESLAFQRDRLFFGETRERQTQCRLRELHAWYSLVDTDTIEDTMNVCPLFINNSSEWNYQTWLETVTML